MHLDTLRNQFIDAQKADLLAALEGAARMTTAYLGEESAAPVRKNVMNSEAGL